jgi:hypothetical protein
MINGTPSIPDTGANGFQAPENNFQQDPANNLQEAPENNFQQDPANNLQQDPVGALDAGLGLGLAADVPAAGANIVDLWNTGTQLCSDWIIEPGKRLGSDYIVEPGKQLGSAVLDTASEHPYIATAVTASVTFLTLYKYNKRFHDGTNHAARSLRDLATSAGSNLHAKWRNPKKGESTPESENEDTTNNSTPKPGKSSSSSD